MLKTLKSFIDSGKLGIYCLSLVFILMFVLATCIAAYNIYSGKTNKNTKGYHRLNIFCIAIDIFSFAMLVLLIG